MLLISYLWFNQLSFYIMLALCWAPAPTCMRPHPHAGIERCTRNAARARLQLASHVLACHGQLLVAQIPSVVDSMKTYLQSMHHVENATELARLGFSLMECLLPALVDSVIDSMASLLHRRGHGKDAGRDDAGEVVQGPGSKGTLA